MREINSVCYLQACKFIQQGPALIWLIVAQLHVLRINRAASGDCVLAQLNRTQNFQQQTDTVHWASDELLHKAVHKMSKTKKNKKRN